MRISMKWTAFIALLMALTSLGQDAGQQGQQKDQQGEIPTFRKNVNVVNVFFTVRDHHGALLPNLTKDDFEVMENGKPQTIKYFAAETNLPLTLGVLIDSSLSMKQMLEEEQVVGADFLHRVITERDLAFVISFDISVDLLQDLTSDSHLLRDGLNQAHINTSTSSGGIPGLGQGPIPISHPAGTLLYDAVYLAADEILGKQVGRKALILLTDGNDEGSKLKLRDAIEAAQKADAICYVLLLHDPAYGPPGASEMRQLTEQTGGRVIEVNNPKKISDAFNQISNELRSQYSLGYSPDDARRDGSFRKIEVKSKSGNKVQARKGYYAPTS